MQQICKDPEMSFRDKVMWLLAEHRAAIGFTLTKGCRCMGCHSYQVELDCGDTVIQDEDLDKCINKAWDKANGPCA